MHLLPRDEMRPDVERMLQPPAGGRPGEPVDSSGFRARLERGRLGVLYRYGLLAASGGNVAYFWADVRWAIYVGAAGVGLLLAANVGAFVAVLRAR
jgi:hypothetical protein